MSRISSFNSNQNVLSQFLRVQKELYQAQAEVSSGKRATDLQGHGRAAETITATLATRDRYQSYVDTSKAIIAQVEAQNLALEEVGTSGSDFRQALLEAVAANSGVGMMDAVQAAYEKAAAALNMNFGGKYVFSGARTDVPPVTATSLDDLAALPTSDDAFQNDTLRAKVQIDDGVSLQYGLLAKEDIAEDLFEVFKTVKDYADANGGLTGTLTDTQRDALMAHIQTLSPVADDLNNVLATNGHTFKRLSTASERQEQRVYILEGLISDMSDADLADAASRLQMGQTALQAAAQVFNSLRDASLLNYLT